jgi:hypothetical protein
LNAGPPDTGGPAVAALIASRLPDIDVVTRVPAAITIPLAAGRVTGVLQRYYDGRGGRMYCG